MRDDPEILRSVHAEGPAAVGGRLPLSELARIAAGLRDLAGGVNSRGAYALYRNFR
jgi:hypothetical protein